MIDLIDHLLDDAGKKKRCGDLFSTGGFMGKLGKSFQGFKDVPNVFTQHTPYLGTIIENLNKGKLKESEFTSIER